MPESDPRMDRERPSATGPWRPAPSSLPADDSSVLGDSPTVVTGQGGVQASGSGARESSSGWSSRPERTPPLPVPGERLDAYVVEAAIGVGGMGAVFRAHDDPLERIVALKILPPELARDPEAVRRFYQEGRSAAQLDHENIARVYTIGHAPPHHYIAFEFIEGETLRQRVEGGGVLPVGDAIRYTLQIAGALVHAAERGVIHRDVKPSNIIVTPMGRAKLVDMGLARRFERGGDAGLTHTGMTLGTFDYISPEQARDPRNVDVRSDLYSLGCTLYYMLAGRPPFPDGTVLQKLLQHQEEPPPDVRAANPEVPAGLASIVVKLMAKDRERRYQTPGELVLDLDRLAAALDVRIAESRLMALTKPGRPWGRRRVGLLVAGCLVAVGMAIPTVALWPRPGLTPGNKPAVVATETAVGLPQPIPLRPAAEPAVPAASPRAATVRRVRRSEDLTRLLAESTPGTTLILDEEGLYDLHPAPGPITPRDITLRSGVGAARVVRLAGDTHGSREASAMIDLKGGRLAIDGLEFEVNSDDRDAPLSAIRTEGTELSMIRCTARRVGTDPGRGRTAGLHLRSVAGVDREHRAEVVIDACHFEGGQYAILAEGPVELTTRDTTFGGARSATVLTLNKDAPDRAATLRFHYASAMLGNGPFLRSVGLAPRVVVKDSVIATVVGSSGTLVLAEEPALLNWQGRDNLYAGIGTYLADLASPRGMAPIRSFEVWADDPSTARDPGSTASPVRVWYEPDPTLLLSGYANNPSLAFRVATPRGIPARAGARRGPMGVLPGAGARPLVAVLPSPARPDPAGPAPPAAGLVARKETAPPVVEREPPARPLPMPMPMEMPAQEDLGEDMPPDMPNMPSPVSTVPGQVADVRGQPVLEPRPPAVPEPTPLVAPREPDGRWIRSAAQLVEALGRAGPRGETLRLASDVDWEMPPCQVRGNGPLTLQAEPGKPRPRIRFRPRLGGATTVGPWTAWISLLSGSLRIKGVDVVLPREEAPGTGGWAAFSAWPGTVLSVSDCTVTIEGNPAASAAIVAPSTPPPKKGAGVANPERLTASVRLENSLFRGQGDLIDVSGDRKLDLLIENAVVVATGSLIHGHGRSRELVDEPAIKLPLLRATLQHVTSRTESGLIRLEGTDDRPELPVAEVVARNSVFSTDGKGRPLIEVDGKDDIDSLRDVVRWDGQVVAYHRITIYRRDFVGYVGKPNQFPAERKLDQNLWSAAAGPGESNPMHGDAGFLADWASGRPAWSARPDDLRLRVGGQAAGKGAGSELGLIPEPPAARS